MISGAPGLSAELASSQSPVGSVLSASVASLQSVSVLGMVALPMGR